MTRDRSWRPRLPFVSPSSAQARYAVWFSLVLTGLVYVVFHHVNADTPRALDGTGWWHWHDQRMYLQAAQAWAAGNLAPSQHWYLPGYPLMAAPFVWLAPVQPFYIPDLLCLLVSVWLFAELAGCLAPDRGWGRLTGSLVFPAMLLLSTPFVRSFVEPWTTTPVTPLIYGSLLLAIRFWDEVSARRAVPLAAVTACIALFRPTEAIVMLAVVGGLAGSALLYRRLDWGRRCAIAMAGMAGAALPLLVLGSLHLAVSGWHAGTYLTQSLAVGFEWRLIALRWVMLFVGPDPLFAGERGMVQVFWWIVPGIAGMAACLVATRHVARIRHVLVIGAMTAHCLAYLAYRDLHPQGLFRFANYHYFKWTLPVFGLYAVYLFVLVTATSYRRAAWATGAAAVAALFCWRPQWHEPAMGYDDADAYAAGETLVLTHGLLAVQDGVRIAAQGDFNSIYLSSYETHVGQKLYTSNADVKAFPIPGGMIFTALRVMRDRTVVDFPPGVHLDTKIQPRFGRQQIVFGWPGWAERAGYRLHNWWRHFEGNRSKG